MDERDWLAATFDELRPRLNSVAYSILGSVSDAEDAVQECWLRLDRSNSADVQDLQAWLITVVGRICLDMLRRRAHRREYQMGDWLPEPIVEFEEAGPEHEVLLADSIGLALLVVLETLSPPERLAFVLHDVFGVPFSQIAPVVERTPEAARQLAARARRRVRAAPTPDPDMARQRAAVDAFLAAARSGDLAGLLEVLDPDVVFRADVGAIGTIPFPVRGAQAVAERVLQTAPRFAPHATPAIVNGQAGAVFAPDGIPAGVIGFTVVEGRIAAIDLVADPAKLSRLSGTSSDTARRGDPSTPG